MRVLLIDDHTLFRRGLTALLARRDVHVIEASCGQEGLERARIEPALDAILLDLRMPDLDGHAVLARLQSEDVATPVIALTTSEDEADLVRCLRAGARGFLLKDSEPEELVANLQAIAAGQTVVTPHLTTALAAALRSEDDTRLALHPAPKPFPELSNREAEVLALLAEGQSNKRIARCMGISDGTVKTYVKSILRKLNVESRLEAAVIAVRHGIGEDRRPPPSTS